MMLDLTSEEDFNFSSAYKSLVSSHYRNKATEIAKKMMMSMQL